MSSLSKKRLTDRHYDDMMLALVPLIICACVIYSTRVLLICGTAFVTARIVDVAMAVIRKQEIDPDDKSSTVAALTFCMMLPVSIPLYVVVMTVAVTILVGKHSFGGKDAYPFSLAALAMCMAAVNWPVEVFRAVKPFTPVNFWTGAAQTAVSGSTRIKNGGLPYISMLDLLLGNHAGTMGTSFIVIIAAIAVYLLVTKRITWHIPLTFVATCAVIAWFFPRIYGISRVDSLKFELLSSAVVFYAVFMLNEPATTPKNPKAKIIFGFLCGVLTMLFRYYGSFETGGCFALLLVNATEGYWDRLFASDKKQNETQKETAVKEKVPAEKKKQTKPQPAAENKDEKCISGENRNESVSRHDEKPEGKKLYKADSADKPAKANHQKPADRKPEEKKEEPKQPKKGRVGSTITMISRAEDDIDQVEFSTMSIDVNEALRDFEEKYGKEGK